MRPSFWFLTPLVLLSGVAALSACSGSSSAEKSEKIVPLSGKEEGIIRVAHATESGGDLASAERLYKQAISMSGNKAAAHIELAEFYKRHNETHAAIKELNEAHELQPKNVDIMRELANTYINDGSPDKALALLSDALAINSKDALLYNSKGVALDMQGNYSDAQKAYKTASLLNPDDDMTYKANLSMSYILSGSYNQAIHLLLPMLNSLEVTPNIRQNLALAYGLKGDSESALKLGLKDLSTKEAQENLKFYRMLAANQGNGKNAVHMPVIDESAAAAHMSSDNPFMEEDSETPTPVVTKQAAKAAPVAPVTMHDDADTASAPAVLKKYYAQPSPTMSNTEAEDAAEEEKSEQDEKDVVLKPSSYSPSAGQKPMAKITPAAKDEDDSESQSSTIAHAALPSPVLKPDMPE